MIIEGPGPEHALKVDRLRRRLLRVVRSVMDHEGETIIGAVRERLSGPVLRVRTGRLRNSITKRVKLLPEAVELRIGTNVEYAARHEFGFHGEESVSGHFRKQRMVFGRRVRGLTVYVRPHERIANTPARPFLRPSATEALPRLQKAMIEALRDELAARR